VAVDTWKPAKRQARRKQLEDVRVVFHHEQPRTGLRFTELGGQRLAR